VPALATLLKFDVMSTNYLWKFRSHKCSRYSVELQLPSNVNCNGVVIKHQLNGYAFNNPGRLEPTKYSKISSFSTDKTRIGYKISVNITVIYNFCALILCSSLSFLSPPSLSWLYFGATHRQYYKPNVRYHLMKTSALILSTVNRS
jgi:hypothetical protein